MPPAGCPPPADLAAFARGELTPDGIDAVGRHLDGCPACERALDALDADPDPLLAALGPGGGYVTGLGPDRAATVPGGPRSPGDGPPAPRRLAGYEVAGELGRGGMGVVYKGWDPVLKRAVALKVIRAGGYASAEEAVRFRREAEAVARVRHPGLVQIYEVGSHDGLPFLALEFVAGGTLERFLAGRPQPPASAARLVAALAEAVHAAHTQGVVHRDLKPGNILLSNADCGLRTAESSSHPETAGAVGSESAFRSPHSALPKITDFGLAKCLDGSAGVTASGVIAGTPAYMAPEQAAGRTRDIGPAADVYALGAILYEVLVGHPPFQGESATDTLLRVLHADPVPPSRLRPRVPKDLETVCLKCLSKDPAGRYPSALALAADLGRFLADVPMAARRAGPAERFLRLCRRNPLPAALAGLVAASLMAGTAGSAFYAVRADRSAAEARANEGRATAARDETRRNLYFAQMHLAGEARYSNRALAQIGALLDPWRPAAGRPDGPGWEWYYLDSLGREECRLLPHDAPVTALSWDAAGTRLAGLDHRGGVRVWDADAGRVVRDFPPADPVALAAALSPDGDRLAAAGRDGSVRVYGVADGAVRQTLAAGRGGPLAVAWTPDGTGVRTVAAGDGGVRVWDPATGELRPTPAGVPGVYKVVPSPDGSRLAAWSAGRVWVTAPAGRRPVDAGETFEVAWSRDGRRLAAARPDHAITLLDPDTGQTLANFRGHRHRVTALDWSPDGSAVASASFDHAVRVWDAADGAPRHTYLGHTGPVAAVAWSPRGDRIASAGTDGAARVWPVRREAVPVAADGLTSVTWSGDSARLVVTTAGGRLRVIDRFPLRVDDEGRAIPANAVAAAWAPAGDRVACTRPDGVLRVVDARTGATVRNLPAGRGAPAAVAWHPAGGRLAAAGPEGVVRVWDLTRGRAPRTLMDDGADALAVAWSPDGRFLAAAVGGRVVVWDAAEVRVRTLTRPPDAGPADHFSRLAWGPNGTEVAAGGTTGRVFVWALSGDRPRLVLAAAQGELRGLSWSPDGRRIASAAAGAGVRVWDSATGTPALSLDADGDLSDLAWSPDGTALAGVTKVGGRLAVWDAAPGYRAHARRSR